MESLGIGITSFLHAMDLADLTKRLLKIHGMHPHKPPPLPKAVRDLCSTCGISDYDRWCQVDYSCPELLYTPKSAVGLMDYKLLI